MVAPFGWLITAGSFFQPTFTSYLPPAIVRFSWALTTLLSAKVSTTAAMIATTRRVCFIKLLLVANIELSRVRSSITANAEVLPGHGALSAKAMFHAEVALALEPMNQALP